MIRGPDWLSIVIRAAFLLVVVVTGIYLYRRYEVVSVGKNDDSMETKIVQNDGRVVVQGFPRNGLVLVDLADVGFERNQTVAYAASGDSQTEEELRVGRLWGIPGDRLQLGKQGLLINGSLVRLGKSPIFRFPQGLADQGGIFEDQYLVLNDNFDSMLPDSRNFGFLRREQIRGTVVRNWPW